MPGGKIVLVGMGHPIQTLPISEAALKEVDLIGVFRYANQYPKAINLISEHHGVFSNINNLVTARYGLEQAKEAFEAVRGRQGSQSHGDKLINSSLDLILKIVSIEKEPNPKHHNKSQKHPSLPNKTSDEKMFQSGIKETDVGNQTERVVPVAQRPIH